MARKRRSKRVSIEDLSRALDAAGYSLEEIQKAAMQAGGQDVAQGKANLAEGEQRDADARQVYGEGLRALTERRDQAVKSAKVVTSRGRNQVAKGEKTIRSAKALS